MGEVEPKGRAGPRRVWVGKMAASLSRISIFRENANSPWCREFKIWVRLAKEINRVCTCNVFVGKIRIVYPQRYTNGLKRYEGRFKKRPSPLRGRHPPRPSSSPSALLTLNDNSPARTLAALEKNRSKNRQDLIRPSYVTKVTHAPRIPVAMDGMCIIFLLLWGSDLNPLSPDQFRRLVTTAVTDSMTTPRLWALERCYRVHITLRPHTGDPSQGRADNPGKCSDPGRPTPALFDVLTAPVPSKTPVYLGAESYFRTQGLLSCSRETSIARISRTYNLGDTSTHGNSAGADRTALDAPYDTSVNDTGRRTYPRKDSS
ncbi:hypothetical protein EVAR_6086_1 [Eumeta japonica]|uniref:Uncharacterized protein n=1 Tax=Eumeta variegata TaxID=151549 RepID=A0A4C1TE55_EUMVA|nr:hypothetical protein EVAR_6086_1 [Eumeta japonica]